jgi:uncharacterized protein DUF1554
MRLLLCPAFVGMMALVQGCSGPSATTEDSLLPGDEDPASPAPVAGDPAKKPDPAAAPPAPGAPPAPTPPATPPGKSTMTFFVTSTGSLALGGNLGGLAGADKKCQDLAVAVKGGDHTWHAYLSITGTNAKDRIGPGPWTNQQGKVIAATVAALHDYKFVPASALLLDEKGALVPKGKNSILTGSKQDGTPSLQNCQGWTSATANQQGHVGDTAADTSVILGANWNDAAKNATCTQQGLTLGGGEGRLYCFAID